MSRKDLKSSNRSKRESEGYNPKKRHASLAGAKKPDYGSEEENTFQI